MEFSVTSPIDAFKGGDGLGIYYLKSVPKKAVQKTKFGYLTNYMGLGIFLDSTHDPRKPMGQHSLTAKAIGTQGSGVILEDKCDLKFRTAKIEKLKIFYK